MCLDVFRAKQTTLVFVGNVQHAIGTPPTRSFFSDRIAAEDSRESRLNHPSPPISISYPTPARPRTCVLGTRGERVSFARSLEDGATCRRSTTRTVRRSRLKPNGKRSTPLFRCNSRFSALLTRTSEDGTYIFASTHTIAEDSVVFPRIAYVYSTACSCPKHESSGCDLQSFLARAYCFLWVGELRRWEIPKPRR